MERDYWGALDQLGLVQALRSVAASAAVTGLPKRGWQLGLEWAKIAVGRSEVRPAPRDWRFKNRAWEEHPVFSRLGRAYLAWVAGLLRPGRRRRAGLAHGRTGPAARCGT